MENANEKPALSWHLNWSHSQRKAKKGGKWHRRAFIIRTRLCSLPVELLHQAWQWHFLISPLSRSWEELRRPCSDAAYYALCLFSLSILRWLSHFPPVEFLTNQGHAFKIFWVNSSLGFASMYPPMIWSCLHLFFHSTFSLFSRLYCSALCSFSQSELPRNVCGLSQIRKLIVALMLLGIWSQFSIKEENSMSKVKNGPVFLPAELIYGLMQLYWTPEACKQLSLPGAGSARCLTVEHLQNWFDLYADLTFIQAESCHPGVMLLELTFFS